MFPLAFIIVHGGAGVHGYKDEQGVKAALKTACTEALKAVVSSSPSQRTAEEHQEKFDTAKQPCVQSQSPSLNVVEKAIKSLENDERLNAGYGSNLTCEGTVECDASIMHGSGLFGGVGALSGIQNPISAARAVLEYSMKRDQIGRVPPLTLVSHGARTFASSRGVPTVLPESLIAPSAKEKWKKWKNKLEQAASDAMRVQRDQEIMGEEGLMDMQDTVGAVSFCMEDDVAAGVSSGGLLLKYPGRIGEAAVYGAGCWAASSGSKSSTGQKMEGVACSVSGTGEDVIRLALARRIGEALAPRRRRDSEHDADKDPHGVLENLLREFWESGREEGRDWLPSAGVIVLTAEEGDDRGEPRVRLWCAFTTASMAIGYGCTRDMKAKAMIVRHPQARSGADWDLDKPQIYITSLLLQ